jgi:serine/threonine-protein kinase RsbW
LSRFRITIDSDLNSLFLISLAVRGICEHAGLEGRDISALEVCAVEAVSNAIRHAYRGAPGREVALDVRVLGHSVELTIQDEGVAMPPERAKALEARLIDFDFDPDDLNSLPEGGMGLKIIRAMMDEATYVTEDGVNRLKLVRNARQTHADTSARAVSGEDE